MTRPVTWVEPANLPTKHAGLWLDKYLGRIDDDAGTQKKALIQELAGHVAPVGYRAAFEARRQALVAEGATDFRAVALGRLIVGLGAKGVLEAGISLERTWGVPFLPGSSLKGVAAAAAHQLADDPQAWGKHVKDGALDPTARETPNEFDALFGTVNRAGRITFYDAWWIPESDTARVPLDLDVMTPHHKDYYAGKEGAFPTDFDEPTPVPFVTTRGAFLVLLQATPEDGEYLRAAEQLLRWGLADLGIGAKTNAGYGRMDLCENEETKKKADAEAAAQNARESGRARLATALRGVRGKEHRNPAVNAVRNALAAAVPRDVILAIIQAEKKRLPWLLQDLVSQFPELGGT